MMPLPGPKTLRLALPSGDDLTNVCALLRRCGFDLPEIDSIGLYPVIDPLGIGVDFEIFRLAPADVGTYVEHGISQLGVMSTELIRESDSRVWRPYTFPFGNYPLVLAAPHGITLDTLMMRPTVRLATSLPQMTRDIFAARGMAIEVVPVEDTTTACLLGLSDGYVDRLVSPNEIIAQGFRVLEVVGRARLKLIVNKASYPMRRAAIDAFIEALALHEPNPSESMEIPFDSLHSGW